MFNYRATITIPEQCGYTMPKNLEISSTTSNHYLELAKTMRSLGGNMALAAEAIEHLTAELAEAKTQLVKEAARTADYKQRYEQINKQHSMLAARYAAATLEGSKVALK